MKRPLDRGAAVDAQRYKRWLATFSGYHDPVTQQLIELWLDLFEDDRDLGARVLDVIHFITFQHMQTSFREILGSLDGWSPTQAERQGRWFFVPFSGSTGESGDRMVHEFRVANSLTGKHHNPMFIHRSELVQQNPGPDDTVLLIDDFSGTGKQASEAWSEVFEELLTGQSRVFLVLVAATARAISQVRENTRMVVLCRTRLNAADNIFDNACAHFTRAEKETLLRYCTVANKKNPRGFGDCGLVAVLAHRCPNNTIPVLHAVHGKWSGLFPRHL